jgi:hypothetical protein
MTTSKTTQTESKSQKTDPWAPAMPSVERGLSAASDVFTQRQNQQFFPGQTYANFAPETEQALTGMTNRAQAGSPLVRGAQGMVGDTLNGNYLSAGNPYFSQMSDRITSEVLPSITSQWAKAGRGTGNDQVVEAASRGLGDSIGQLAYQNYGQERSNQMQAANMAPTLANQDYADLERLAGVGQMRQDQTQRGIDEQRQRYQFEQDRGANALREFQGFTSPVAQLGQTSTSQGTTTSQQQQSPVQTAIGAGLMGASLFTGAGPMAGMMGAGGPMAGLMKGFGPQAAPSVMPNRYASLGGAYGGGF